MPQKLQKPELELEPLPPEEAIKFFKDKIIMPAKEFYALEGWARSRAFTVSYVTKAEVLNDIHAAVDEAISNGTTLADFRNSLKDIAEQRGWTGLTPWHEETVFRTNIQTAYSVARYEHLEGMVEKFDWQFSAIMDDRTTGTCSELNGKIYPLDSPFWNIYTPPLHFNCRSALVPILKSTEESKGLTVESALPSDEHRPPKGFDVNPAKVPYKPDLSGMPEELKAMVEKDLK